MTGEGTKQSTLVWLRQAKEKKPTKEELKAQADAAAAAAKKEAENRAAQEAAGSAPEAKFEPAGGTPQMRVRKIS